MNTFELYILGCGSATPTLRHNPSAQIVNLREKHFMIDCGEGTQLQLRGEHVNFNRVNDIFISHLHGDHCFGLMGLISTQGMLGRTAPLRIYAPAPLEALLQPQLDFFCKGLAFKISFETIDPKQHTCIYDDRSVAIYTIPLHHRIPTCGFLFKEKPSSPHILPDMLDFYHIPRSQINNIKAGNPWITAEGKEIPYTQLTRSAEAPRSYAYCCDTIFDRKIIPFIAGIDCLYHEATFAQEHEKRAQITYHSTASQAATIAKEAGVKQLILGHFSARYKDENILQQEAAAIFPNTFMANEGITFKI